VRIFPKFFRVQTNCGNLGSIYLLFEEKEGEIMENSGVHAVFAFRKTLIQEVVNRMTVCELNPVQINDLTLANSTTRGEVLVRSLGVEIAVRADVNQDNLRVFIEI
jgi:hypothetical protein